MNKPTENEIKEKLVKLEERRKDKIYNGKDQEKDRNALLAKENNKLYKAKEVFNDNLKSLNNFLAEYNMKSVYDYVKADSFVRYPFDTFDLYGSSPKENQDIILNRHKKFLDQYGITKINLDNPLETFSFLPNSLDVLRANRIKEEYNRACIDRRFFIPEFIIGISAEYLTEHFFIHLIDNDLCDGIVTKSFVPEQIYHRLHWEVYPTIFIDREVGTHIHDEIKSSSTFLKYHNEYIDL